MYKTSYFDIEKDQEIDLLLKWMSQKKNVIELYNKQKITNDATRYRTTFQDAIANSLYDLPILISLLFNRPYSYNASDFYIIIVTQNRVFIHNYNFDQKATKDDFINLLSLLYNKFNKFKQFDKLEQILLYFPFMIGNIFSKKRYLFEINTFYMELLTSYRSIDKNRKTILKNHHIAKEQAIISEALQNESFNYSNKYAYIDYIDMFLKSGDIPIYYIDISKQDEVFNLLNQIDSYYFEMVSDQQETVYITVKNELQIPENKKGKYTFSKRLEELIRKINNKDKKDANFRAFNKYLKSIQKQRINKSTFLSRLQNDFRKGQLGQYDEMLFKELGIQFPFLNNKDYASEFKDLLSNTEGKIEIDSIIDLLFGNKSCLYSANDKRKIFFHNVKKLFNIYYTSGYEHKDFKYLYDFNWQEKIL